MSTPTNERTPPSRVFENYIFTKVLDVGANLSDVADVKMQQLPGPVGAGGTDDGYTSPLNIGFPFQIDGKIYTKYVVDTNGWMVLVDPAVGTFTSTDVVSSEFANSSIVAPFVHNHVLLAPWFSDLRNVSDTLANAQSVGTLPSLTAAQQLRITYGMDLPPATVNPSGYGVRYINNVDVIGRRRLIIRWFSLSNYQTASTILKFEVVLYENGLIEFRYAPKLSFGKYVGETATIGIFLNNDPNVSWRFRDLSTELGYTDPNGNTRPKYIYGGAVYNSGYTDVGHYYNNNLTPQSNWPGISTIGSIFSFQPPVLRRKILPRLELRERDSKISFPLVARTGDVNRLGNFLTSFDDRRTVNYLSGVVVNYPTTLPRFYGNSEKGIADRQNLFSQDFEFTASMVKGVIEQFVGNVPKSYIAPFSEHHHLEQGAASLSSSYFLTGSDITTVGSGFTNPLKSKTQIKISLPVSHPTLMFDVTSSIYYYNRAARGWYMPRNSNPGSDLVDVTNLAPQDDGGAFGSGFSFMIEDARGFGAIGNTISSGSYNYGTTPTAQTDANIGYNNQISPSSAQWMLSKQTDTLSTLYKNSVQNNTSYIANGDELFTLPINQPFLIEKAVFEIPLTLGPGWFNDRTTCGVPQRFSAISSILNCNTSMLDFAGPALTVALFCQQTSGPVTHRDLILTGTIIPVGDNIQNVKYAYVRTTGTFVANPEGFQSFGASPGAVVVPNTLSGTTLSFTGTVTLPTVAAVSNGVVLAYQAISTNPFGLTPDGVGATFFSNILTSPTLAIQYSGFGNIFPTIGTQTFVRDIDPFGRSASGFSPSGRSIFGKEFVTSQNLNIQGGSVPNPLYVSSSYLALPAGLQAALTTMSSSHKGVMSAVIPLETTFVSPYIVNPGDKLTLSISKMRPLLFSVGRDPNTGAQVSELFTGSHHHDVSLLTGSITVTFYGSLVQQATEFHDSLNQPLASDAIHELIGGDPVLDQNDIEYRGTYWGSYTDNYVTGSLVSQTVIGGKTFIVTGSRGKVFSNYYARQQPAPDQSTYELAANPYEAFRLQPWSEKVGTVRFFNTVNFNERYYDSMMPNLTDCFAANNASIFTENLSAAQEEYDTTRMINPSSPGITPGYLYFNYSSPLLMEIGIPSISDCAWTWSYPFEPRYNGITRQSSVGQNINAMTQLNIVSGMTLSATLKPVTNFLPIFAGHVPNEPYSLATLQGGTNADSFTLTKAYPVDVNLAYVNVNNRAAYLTSSVISSDLAKIMFGFGDVNNMMFQLGEFHGHAAPNVSIWLPKSGSVNGYQYTPNTTYGWNHSPDYRSTDKTGREVEFSLSNYAFSVAPIIRGWKYGAINALPYYSNATFRRNKFGQLRDMLEQRQYTKYFGADEGTIIALAPHPLDAVVTVKFVDSDGNLTSPENTWSHNLSIECTSSMPYFDGFDVSRPEIVKPQLNKSIVTFKSNPFGNIRI